MNGRDEKMVDTHVWLPKGLRDRVERLAARRHQRLAEAFREALREWCDKNEPAKGAEKRQETTGQAADGRVGREGDPP